jgi:hypothetical protein
MSRGGELKGPPPRGPHTSLEQDATRRDDPPDAFHQPLRIVDTSSEGQAACVHRDRSRARMEVGCSNSNHQLVATGVPTTNGSRDGADGATRAPDVETGSVHGGVRRCRICFEEEACESGEALLQLKCLCRGDLSLVHASCADTWFKRRGAWHGSAKNPVACVVPNWGDQTTRLTRCSLWLLPPP